MTPIQRLGDWDNNCLWVKREDFIPFSFGGNKARKAQLFFLEIDAGKHDAVVTYGSSSSNHCRVVANMAAQRGIGCYIISPEEASEETFNTNLMRLFRAEITVCPVEKVSATIDAVCNTLRGRGMNPYFIPGGGHGNTGTQAYVDCYEEIEAFEKQQSIRFDYIFLASGTGTTHAGLVCGQLIRCDDRKIVGISIARRNPRGRDVVLESIRQYLMAKGGCFDDATIEDATVFLDDYIGEGYGRYLDSVGKTVDIVMKKYGIPLDATYTGKAFWGMADYIEKNDIRDKNILFIHTGGTPLFFDYLKSKER
ncbi:MAG: pyridoxal-phosphate dependent enzyme [Oscillospiraceae bacterium]|nr:pyridoxal-phosphate dependent enzyme [Oscillospiraceae bacterium]